MSARGYAYLTAPRVAFAKDGNAHIEAESSSTSHGLQDYEEDMKDSMTEGGPNTMAPAPIVSTTTLICIALTHGSKYRGFDAMFNADYSKFYRLFRQVFSRPQIASAPVEPGGNSTPVAECLPPPAVTNPHEGIIASNPICSSMSPYPYSIGYCRCFSGGRD